MLKREEYLKLFFGQFDRHVMISWHGSWRLTQRSSEVPVKSRLSEWHAFSHWTPLKLIPIRRRIILQLLLKKRGLREIQI